jgi:hypothetical protein
VATTKPVGKDYVKERLKLIKAKRKAGIRWYKNALIKHLKTLTHL